MAFPVPPVFPTGDISLVLIFKAERILHYTVCNLYTDRLLCFGKLPSLLYLSYKNNTTKEARMI